MSSSVANTHTPVGRRSHVGAGLVSICVSSAYGNTRGEHKRLKDFLKTKLSLTAGSTQVRTGAC